MRASRSPSRIVRSEPAGEAATGNDAASFVPVKGRTGDDGAEVRGQNHSTETGAAAIRSPNGIARSWSYRTGPDANRSPPRSRQAAQPGEISIGNGCRRLHLDAENPFAPGSDDEIDLVALLVTEVRERAPVSGPARELEDRTVNEAFQLRPERCPVPAPPVGREVPMRTSMRGKQ